MTEFLLTAPGSGTGKTTLMTAVLTLLRREGRETAAFKCGPDYIDPMFHRAVEGVHSYNLDLFLNDASTVRRIYSRYTKYCDAAVVEGVMGHYDGVGGSTDHARPALRTDHEAGEGQPDAGGSAEGAAAVSK